MLMLTCQQRLSERGSKLAAKKGSFLLQVKMEGAGAMGNVQHFAKIRSLCTFLPI